MLHPVEELKIIQGLAPQVGAAAAVTGDWISVKNAHKIYAVINYNQADGVDIRWDVYRATAVAPTGNVVVATVGRIWSNLDTDTSDRLVERTAAINYSSGVGATKKQIIFEIDPATLGDNAATPPVDYDCIAVGSNTAIAAGQYVSITYIVIPRYASRVATQPTVITD